MQNFIQFLSPLLMCSYFWYLQPDWITHDCMKIMRPTD